MNFNTAQNQPQAGSSSEALRFSLSVNEAIRIQDPKVIGYKELNEIFKVIEATPVKDLIKIREKTYDVLDRMDEILLEGGKVSPDQADEIIRGIAVLEEIIIKKIRAMKPSERQQEI